MPTGRCHLGDAAGPEVELDRPGPKLTEREREVLLHTVRGLTEKEIANVLDMSPHTVRIHIENSKRKFGSRNKIDLVVTALRNGLVEFPAGGN